MTIYSQNCLFQSLRHNNDTVLNNKKFKDYEAPIERTSWVRNRLYFMMNWNDNSLFVKVRKAAARYSSAEAGRWEGCTIEMEQTGSPGGSVDFGTLSIFGNSKRSNKVRDEV